MIERVASDQPTPHGERENALQRFEVVLDTRTPERMNRPLAVDRV
jgi:hypothetical protein